MSDDIDRIIDGLSWNEKFTIKYCLTRWVIPMFPFEMTASERRASHKFVVRGLARETLFSWRLTPLGQRVRARLLERDKSA